MKKKQFLKTTLLALVLTLGGATTAWAEEVECATIDAVNTAIGTLTDDGAELVIKLTSSDTYSGEIKFPKGTQGGHLITIKAADNTTVTWAGKLSANNGNPTDGNGFIFDGIIIQPSGNNFTDWLSKAGNITQLTFRNCEITQGTSYFRIYDGNSAKTIDLISFDNCKIHGISEGMLITTTHVVKAVSVTNCILYNYQGNYFFKANSAAASDQGFTFTFTNNTVYQFMQISSRGYFVYAVETDGYNDANTTYTIKDNVIAGYYGYTTDGSDSFKLVRANKGTAYVNNNILLGFNTSNRSQWFWQVDSKPVLNYGDGHNYPIDGALSSTFGFASDTGIPFTDAANGDFTINLNNYPAFATASTVGSPLGAPSTWKYTWNSGTAKAGTLILPYEANIPAGITAFTLTYTSGSSATATEINTGILPANTPVLLNAETASKDYCFTSTGTVPNAAPADLAYGAMTGVYTAGYVPADSYVLQKGAEGLGFYKVAADNTISINPYRAYLTPGQDAEAPMISIVFNDDMTTGIGNITSAPSKDEGVAYNLAGQRVANGYKGLVIKNGKKYIIK